MKCCLLACLAGLLILHNIIIADYVAIYYKVIIYIRTCISSGRLLYIFIQL